MRLLTDGAEFGDLLAVSTYGGSGIAVSTAQKRTGAYSYLLTGDQAAMSFNFTSSQEIFIRFCIYRNGTEAGDVETLKLYNSTTLLAILELNRTTSLFKLYRGNRVATLFTATYTIPLQTWKMVELRILFNATTGIAELKIDGALDPTGSFTGNTGATPVTIARFNTTNATSTYFDDLAINNTDNSDGKNDISWPGDGHVELLRPNGNSPDGGWSDSFVGSDGNSVDNYALVDEVPPSSSDYVQSETVGVQDRYAITDWSGSGKRIKRVWAEARALDVSSSGSKLKLGLRVSGADYLSSGKTLLGAYSRILGDEYKVNPATTAEWSNGELDAVQSLIEVAA